MDVNTVGYDATFELSEFQEPRIRSEAETLKDVLMFILFSKPGSYPSLPQIGMNIEDRLYSFYDEIDEEQLEAELIEQCSLMGAYISSGQVMIRKLMFNDEPSLIIQVQASDSYPVTYKHDNISDTNTYMIGITYDDLNQMLVNINSVHK